MRALLRSIARRHTPDIDTSTVGIDFVDILFALVIGLVLERSRNFSDVTIAGWAHLTVATVLTLTSWIGYHLSTNRPVWKQRFFNVPLGIFALDILMVVAYWFAAVTAEPVSDEVTASGTVRPDTLLVLASFVLYVFWDHLSNVIRTDERYAKRLEKFYTDRSELQMVLSDREATRRRRVTAVVAVLSLLVTLGAWSVQRAGETVAWWTAVLFDIALLGLLLGFRIAKDYRAV